MIDSEAKFSTVIGGSYWKEAYKWLIIEKEPDLKFIS